MSLKERQRLVKQAASKATRAAQYLSDASRLLSDAGFVQASRAMHTASYEAVNAISQAEHDLAEGTDDGQ